MVRMIVVASLGDVPIVVLTSQATEWLIVTVSPAPGVPACVQVVVPLDDQFPLALEVKAVIQVDLARALKGGEAERAAEFDKLPTGVVPSRRSDQVCKTADELKHARR